MIEKDIVIVGAGPSGLAAGLYAGRALMDAVILERKIVGGQIIEAYDVDNYPGFPDGISGPELSDQMQKHTEKFGIDVVSEAVKEIQLEGPFKCIITSKNEYKAPIVILASGADHRRLGVPGEERLSGHGVSYCATCDGPFFKDKELVVVGGGDAATTESIFLSRFASHINIIHRRQGFRARPVHVKEARENEKIDFVLDTVVTEIQGEDAVEGVTVRNVQTDEEKQLDCDGVFIFIGHEANTDFLEGILARYAGGVIPVDYNMETEVPGVYAVGDVRKGSYRQVATGVGEAVVATMHAEERLKMLVG